MCADTTNTRAGAGEGSEDHVPDFSTVGFAATAKSSEDRIAQALAAYPDVKALGISGCVTAAYSASTNQVCFTIPIIGQYCFTSPVTLPGNPTIKACFQTCGIIPKGAKVTIYVNGDAVFTKTVGRC